MDKIKLFKLNLCPSCGSEADLVTDDAIKFRVICSNCGLKTWEYCDIEDATEAWNAREHLA